MKILSADLQAHLDSGTTTLCWCWKLDRRDGRVLGFTDHDADVAFDGTVYAGASGLTASQMESRDDLSSDGFAASGALSSQALSEADIAAGRYDGATVEIYRVNWADPAQRVLIRKGWLGEIRRGPIAFEADVKGLTDALNRPVGRAFCYLCDADVGDSRCGLDLAAARYGGQATVLTTSDARHFTADGLAAFATDWFTGGKLTWTGGANAGDAVEVKRHTRTAQAVGFELWQAPGQTIAVGDAFRLGVGCDKAFKTCRTKFANGVNFRGFPHLIGNDAVAAYANVASELDGGSRYGN